MKHKINPHIMTTSRAGIHDVWNAFMVRGASFSTNDIPLCPTTATTIPACMISYVEAKTIHNRELRAGNPDYHINAFVHFFIDDQKFDGKRSSIWLYPNQALSILRHFAGIIAPDFSTNADFPEPIKRWNFYRMNAFGYWIGTQGIPVISNARWGTEETWSYCFDGNPHNSMLAIGTVASGIWLIKNRPLFENGLLKMIEKLNPNTLIIYGSARYECFDVIREVGINVVSYPSKTYMAFAGREHYE